MEKQRRKTERVERRGTERAEKRDRGWREERQKKERGERRDRGEERENAILLSSKCGQFCFFGLIVVTRHDS